MMQLLTHYPVVLEYRVAAVSGASFGLHGDSHGLVLRLSYGLLDGADLAEALRRLRVD